jgi:hypothetical protein
MSATHDGGNADFRASRFMRKSACAKFGVPAIMQLLV